MLQGFLYVSKILDFLVRGLETHNKPWVYNKSNFPWANFLYMKFKKEEKEYTLSPKFDVDPSCVIESNVNLRFTLRFIATQKIDKQTPSPTCISQVNRTQR